MVDNVQVETSTAAVTAAPVVAAPVESSSAVSSPAPVTDPVAPAAPATENATGASSTENVLGDAKPAEATSEVKTEVKAEAKADAKPETKDASKPEIDKTSETVKPEGEVKIELPVYEDFKLPEGVELDKAQLGEFTKVLGEIETGKLDHTGMQEAGQKLVDLATKATTDSINRLNDYYVQIHDSAKKARLDALKADPELGGERFNDTVATLQSSVAEYGGTDAQIAAFRQEVTDAGLEASPALCRLLFNMQQKINKYTTESDNGNNGSNRIVPAARPAPSKVKDYQKFYGGN